MATRRRFLGSRRVDVERIGEAVSRPGIDPRTWVTLGRTEADLDARWYDPDRGWVVDVLTHGTTCHGQSVPCRMLGAFPGLEGYGEYRPPASDEEVVIVFPGGESDEDPIVLGVVTNSDGGGAPKMVAGRSVLPEGVTAPGGPIAAEDCEFSKSPYSSVAEWEGEYHRKAKWITLESGSPVAGIKLGSAAAASPVARADKAQAILNELLGALDTLFGAGVATPAGAGTLTGISSWASTSNQLKAKLAELASVGVVVD